MRVVVPTGVIAGLRPRRPDPVRLVAVARLRPAGDDEAPGSRRGRNGRRSSAGRCAAGTERLRRPQLWRCLPTGRRARPPLSRHPLGTEGPHRLMCPLAHRPRSSRS